MGNDLGKFLLGMIMRIINIIISINELYNSVELCTIG